MERDRKEAAASQAYDLFTMLPNCGGVEVERDGILVTLQGRADGSYLEIYIPLNSGVEVRLKRRPAIVKL